MVEDLTLDAGPTIDGSLVRRLLAAQFPAWSHLSLDAAPSAGTDNVLFRLGDELVVRLPRLERAAGQTAKEQRWLPRLAPHLPLAIPEPVALGEPAEGFPWPWSVCRWLEGQDAVVAPPRDALQTAKALGGFIAALRRIDAAGGPRSGEHSNYRGAALMVLDATARRSVAALADLLDAERLIKVWEDALATPAWNRGAVWVHGDLHPGNLLVNQGRLSAVIDFGLVSVGDPAADVMAAWSVLPREGRAAFRATLAVDVSDWIRARGWAVYAGAVALAHYRQSNPTLAAISRRTLEAVLADA